MVTGGNIQQTSYIHQTEQHSPFRVMLLHLGHETIMQACSGESTVYVCLTCSLKTTIINSLFFTTHSTFSSGNNYVACSYTCICKCTTYICMLSTGCYSTCTMLVCGKLMDVAQGDMYCMGGYWSKHGQVV